MSDQTTPTPTASTRDSDRLQRYVTAQALAERLGMSGAARRIGQRVDRIAGRSGLDPATFTPPDFSTSTFDQNAAQSARAVIGRDARSRGRTMPRPGAFGTKVDQLREQNAIAERTAEWETEGEPAFDRMRTELDRMINTPTFGADYLAKARSQIAAGIKGNSEDRLRTVAATLGLRGMDPSSPAGSAIAGRMALDADAELASSLADFGLKVADMEEKNLGREIGLQSDVVARKIALEAGVKDPSVLYNLNSQLSGLMEALRAQKELEDLQADLAREEQNRTDKFAYMDMAMNGIMGAAQMAGGFGNLFGAGQAAGVQPPSMQMRPPGPYASGYQTGYGFT